jgi:hypothetical protein
MRTIAHMVNPVSAPPSSDLRVAQPVTFESMRAAQRFAAGRVGVRLLAAAYPEDRAAMPEGFETAPDLDRSVLDFGNFAVPRKLPLFADILDRLYAASEGCEYLIYTNVDIALMPSFYLTVDRLIADGYDAFVINRRTIPNTYTSPEQLGLMYAEVGEIHPGRDCFIFPRAAYPSYCLARICIGAVWVGRALALNMMAHALRYQSFTDLHATFHIGDDRVHTRPELAEYRTYNRGEMKTVVAEVEKRIGDLDGHPFIRSQFRQELPE